MNFILSILLGISASGLDVYMAKQGWMPVPPAAFNALICVLIGFQLKFNLKIPQYAKPVVTLMFLIAVLSVVNVALVTLIGTDTEIDPTYTLLPILASILVFCNTAYVAYLAKHDQKMIMQALIIAFLVVFGSVMVDIVKPGTFSKIGTRAAGINVNPNNTYLRLMLLGMSLILLSDNRRVRLLFSILTTLGILFTLSRAGIVFIGLLWAILLVNRLNLNLWNFGRNKKLLINGLLVVGVLYLSKDAIYDGLSQLDAFNNPTSQARLGKLFGKSELFESDDARIQIAMNYFGLIEDNPILGYGAGFSSVNETIDMATHNLYVRLWVELGIVGLLLGVVLFGYIILTGIKEKKSGMLLLGIFLTGMGFFSNGMLDNRALLYCMPVVVVCSFVRRPASGGLRVDPQQGLIHSNFRVQHEYN